MNLDDFIFSENVATPAGLGGSTSSINDAAAANFGGGGGASAAAAAALSGAAGAAGVNAAAPPPPPSLAGSAKVSSNAASSLANQLDEDKVLGHPISSAIPIKSRKESGQQTATQHFVPQSVPVPPHHHQRAGQDEFGYLNRHHRKTSIDDRRVSVTEFPSVFFFFPVPLEICQALSGTRRIDLISNAPCYHSDWSLSCCGASPCIRLRWLGARESDQQVAKAVCCNSLLLHLSRRV